MSGFGGERRPVEGSGSALRHHGCFVSSIFVLYDVVLANLCTAYRNACGVTCWLLISNRDILQREGGRVAPV